MPCPRKPMPVTGAQLAAAAATFDLLSLPGRLHLVCLLAGGEHDVSSLAERSGESIAAGSQQLAKLRAAGIVAARRVGRRQLYRIADPGILRVIELMCAHAGPGGPAAAADDRRREVAPALPAADPTMPRQPA